MKNNFPRIRVNFISNLFGSIFQSIMGLIFIPIYIKKIGIESWGLIGIFTLLLAIFSLLDMGISPTMTRELSKYTSQNKNINSINDLLKTIEIPYWVLSIIVFFVIYLSSSLITKYWIKNANISPEVIKSSLFLIAIIIGLQLPIGFYSASLTGLQKQLNLNLINSFASLFRWGGAALILFISTPTIELYFYWQIISSVLNILFLKLFLWKFLLNKEYKPKFKWTLLLDVLKFSVKMMGITILAIILTQTDKFILVRMMSLESFSYYSLATIISFSILKITGPIINSISPKMIHYIEKNEINQLSILYLKSTEFLSFIVVPACFIIIFFSKEILFLWSKNQLLVENSHNLVSILTLGTMFNTLMVLPYALQIAYGWTSLSIYKNLIAVLIIIPIDFILVKKYGNIGAAAGWLILNLLYVIFEIQIMHKKILKEQKLKWYYTSVIKPLLLSSLIIFVGKLIMPTYNSTIETIIYLFFLLLFSYGLLILFSKNNQNLFYSLLEIKTKIKLKNDD